MRGTGRSESAPSPGGEPLNRQFYDPVHGSIRCDGTDIRELDADRLRIALARALMRTASDLAILDEPQSLFSLQATGYQ